MVRAVNGWNTEAYRRTVSAALLTLVKLVEGIAGAYMLTLLVPVVRGGAAIGLLSFLTKVESVRVAAGVAAAFCALAIVDAVGAVAVWVTGRGGVLIRIAHGLCRILFAACTVLALIGAGWAVYVSVKNSLDGADDWWFGLIFAVIMIGIVGLLLAAASYHGDVCRIMKAIGSDRGGRRGAAVELVSIDSTCRTMAWACGIGAVVSGVMMVAMANSWVANPANSLSAWMGTFLGVKRAGLPSAIKVMTSADFAEKVWIPAYFALRFGLVARNVKNFTEMRGM